MTFEQFWKSLESPMKRGSKLRAQGRYNAIVKRGELPFLLAALEAYKFEQMRESWRRWLYAPSFLDRWEEWRQEERPEAILDELEYAPEDSARRLFEQDSRITDEDRKILARGSKV